MLQKNNYKVCTNNLFQDIFSILQVAEKDSSDKTFEEKENLAREDNNQKVHFSLS
jgi:Ran GTPase-activating protein (RanGAP) involved in mRNA processing and transport